MLGLDGLDLHRIDVHAARYEHVLARVDNRDVALRAAPSDVAGAEPAVGGEGGGALLRRSSCSGSCSAR
jgi:hypothetical protein